MFLVYMKYWLMWPLLQCALNEDLYNVNLTALKDLKSDTERYKCINWHYIAHLSPCDLNPKSQIGTFLAWSISSVLKLLFPFLLLSCLLWSWHKGNVPTWRIAIRCRKGRIARGCNLACLPNISVNQRWDGEASVSKWRDQQTQCILCKSHTVCVLLRPYTHVGIIHFCFKMKHLKSLTCASRLKE